MPEEKIFISVESQIELLKKRGVNIDSSDDNKKAKMMILTEGYYNLINGYKNPFLEETNFPEKYLEGTTIDEIYAVYRFDNELRQAFFSPLLHIETAMKSKVAYVFSEKFGHDNYLKYVNFDTGLRDAERKITELISRLNAAIAQYSKDPRISHYLAHYGYLPLWVLNGVLTMGSVSKFYSLMQQFQRNAIAKDFKINEKALKSFLIILTEVRNICAHGDRLYNITTSKNIPPTAIHKVFEIKKDSKGNLERGINDLFASIIAMKYLLSHSEFKYFCSNCKKVYHRLDKRLKTIDINLIYNMCGFPIEDNYSKHDINEMWGNLCRTKK